MRRGPPPGTPKTPGSGRQAGTPNKATADVRAIAREYGARVIEGLWAIFTTSENDATRIAAGREILDRGYGRPRQGIDLAWNLALLSDEQLDQLERLMTIMAEPTLTERALPAPSDG